MDKHPISDLTEVTLERIKKMIDINTVVGDAITTPDGTTLIPVSKVSVGYGGGGSDFPIKDKGGFGGGTGVGVKMEPVGFLVISNGNVRMINITAPANTTVDRVVDLIPEITDKVEGFVEKRKKAKTEE